MPFYRNIIHEPQLSSSALGRDLRCSLHRGLVKEVRGTYRKGRRGSSSVARRELSTVGFGHAE